MEIFSLIVKLVEFFRDFIIFWSPIKYTLVKEGHQGVRYTFGKVSKPLMTGLHWGTTGQVFDNVQVRKIKSNVNQCESFTKDRIPIRVYGNFTYDIVDASKFLTKSQDTHWLLIEIVEQEIFSWFATRTFTECHNAVMDGSINDELKSCINDSCKEFDLGIEISFVRISDWQIVDPALVRCLSLDAIMSILNEYESPDPYLVGLLVGSQPIIPLQNVVEINTDSTKTD